MSGPTSGLRNEGCRGGSLTLGPSPDVRMNTCFRQFRHSTPSKPPGMGLLGPSQLRVPEMPAGWHVGGITRLLDRSGIPTPRSQSIAGRWGGGSRTGLSGASQRRRRAGGGRGFLKLRSLVTSTLGTRLWGFAMNDFVERLSESFKAKVAWQHLRSVRHFGRVFP